MIHISKELSIEYLSAFHRAVKSHPHIYDMLKDEIHKRARGSAGGTIKAKRASEAQEGDFELSDLVSHLGDEGPVKSANAAPLSGVFSETEDYIDTSVVIAKEGVFTGTDGQPRLKTFNALADSAQWMLGTPITNGHIPGHVEIDTRKIGQIIEVQARPDTKDVFGKARFFKSLLNEDELSKLKEGNPISGSIGYRTPIKSETGRFNDSEYVGIETGPYVLDEYAILLKDRAACTPEQGCGVFKNAAPKLDDNGFPISDNTLKLKDGTVKICPKKIKEVNNMTEELEKKLNSAYTEIESLKAEVEKLKNAEPPAVDFSPIQSEIDSLKEKFANAAKEQDAKRDAEQKAAFGKMLNAAAATELDALWGEVKSLSPIEYESWKQTNAAKLLTEMEKKQATGKKQTNAAGGFDLASEQARVFGY